jgi:predicted amidohydrolase
MFTRYALGAAGTDKHHAFNQEIVESYRLRFAASRRISFSGFLLAEMQYQEEAKDLVPLIFAIQ